MLNQEQRKNEGNTTSANRKILDDPLLSDLREFVDKSVDEYFKSVLVPKFDVKLKMTQSWMNYTEKGQYHHRHEHPNSFISGVFYINANPELDKIYFYNTQYQRIKIVADSYNPYNSESWWLPVETGKLLLFPSNLTHMVQPVETEETRVSIAFNTFPTGYIGDDDSLTGLHL